MGWSDRGPAELFDDETPRILATPKSTAYIKIAEGCDHPCTFCIIPQLRGQFRSRRFESVIAEAERLAQVGVREITLIGQDTTCYGEDFGLKDGLALLLEKLAKIEDLRWIRFLYAYPNKITGKLLETIASSEKICSYMDVPLQHASAPVLKRMKRGGGAEYFCARSPRCGERFPASRCALRSSWAFLGKLKKNSKSCANSCARRSLTGWGRFPIPTRKARTPMDWAERFPCVKSSGAANTSCKFSSGSARRRRRRWWDRNSTCCWRADSEETDLLMEGRTAMHAPEIDGKVFVNEFPEEREPQPGEFYRCQIVEAHDYDLVARIL